MCVIADSKYKRLLEVFAPEEAERVLRFINTTRVESSYLVLSTDSSKAHRTKVPF